MWPIEMKAVYSELEENYCRNPGNSSKIPWCVQYGPWVSLLTLLVPQLHFTRITFGVEKFG